MDRWLPRHYWLLFHSARPVVVARCPPWLTGDNRHAGRFHGDLPVTNIHVSQHLGPFFGIYIPSRERSHIPPNGKLGKSSTSKCHFWGICDRSLKGRSSIRIASVSLGWDQKSSQIWPSGSLRSSLPIVGEVTKKPGLVNAIVSCTYLHTRNSDMNRKNGGYVV